MLFPFPLELFPFPFPLVAQNYSHSHGNPMGIMRIPIPMHTSTAQPICGVEQRRHLYSTGRPSRWALSHISSCNWYTGLLQINLVVQVEQSTVCVYLCVCADNN